jgi:hypothetical protein
MRFALLVIILMSLLLPQLSAAVTLPQTSGGINAYIEMARNLFQGLFSSSTSLWSQPGTPNNASQSLFSSINGWFQSITGIGLNQILFAVFKLLLWIMRALFNLIWSIALWIMSWLK